MKPITFLILAFLAFSSCDRMLLPEEPANDPVNNFELLWNQYDQQYGGFEVKGINWDSLYGIYRPMVSEESTDAQLYAVITALLDHLNDNHVFLFPTDPQLEPYTSGILGRMETFTDFSLGGVRQNYLTEVVSEKSILSGLIENELGYVHFANFNGSTGAYQKTMAELLDKFSNTKGLIIDIRNNEGGGDQASVFLAEYFTFAEKLAFKFKLRNGPAHHDFTEWTDYNLVPHAGEQYANDVVILTNRFSISAAETFVLAMKRNEQVTVVGDTTSGAFSDVIRRELPNGWAYGVSVGDWRDFEGTSFEGIGFPPDVVVQNDSLDVANGFDEALEEAIDLLR